MTTLLRKKDVLAFFGPTNGHTARAFIPILDGKALSKNAIRQWPDIVPELRARQLIEHYPALKELVLDPATRLTLSEMRARLNEPVAPAATTE